jgi:hypothetical protein
MLAAQQFSRDHGRSANAGSEGSHDNVVETQAGTGIAFAQQGHAGIVFQPHGNSKFTPRPAHKVQALRIIVLLIGGDNPGSSRVHQRTKAEGQPEALGSIHSGAFLQRLKGPHKFRKNRP